MATDWDDLQEGVEKTKEYKGADLQPLPAGAWVLMQTVNNPDSAWKPELIEVEGGEKDGRSWSAYWKFRTGLRAIGGDKKCSPSHFGAYARFQTGIEPTEKDEPGSLLSGKIMGFLAALFASGLSEAERGAATFKILRAAGEAQNYDLAIDFDGDKSRLLAASAIDAIMTGPPRRILVKTRHRRYAIDGDTGNQKSGVSVEISVIEDATPEKMAKLGVAIFENAKEYAATSESVTAF